MAEPELVSAPDEDTVLHLPGTDPASGLITAEDEDTVLHLPETLREKEEDISE
ncbi:MAG: hypothetical protein GX141_06675 [Armatimonadetes bacterium]|nr:hypothetical protein [Armatimonadota bacterium]